jgi:hypothetical protein
MLPLVWLGSLLPAAAASTITVSTCDNTSLHNAIDNAAAGDTIVFGCSGTISLSGRFIYEYTILKDLTIDGTGQNVTIDGGGNASMFRVVQGVTLTLKGLTFTGGSGVTFSNCSGCELTDSGGVITVEHGTLNISNSTFTNNISTGLNGGGVILSNLGIVNIDNSSFSGNTVYDSGGAIQSIVSTLTVTNSTFSGNLSRTNGGGINTISGTATISNSTFTGNTANEYSVTGSGAGVANAGDMTITNSTFSGNSAQAGGAIANTVGTLSVIDSTIVGNHADQWANGIVTGKTGGIHLALGGTTTITNTILANGPTRTSYDSYPFGGNCVTNGTLNDGGGNYSDDETCGANHVSTADLKLGTLANNGGPTQTIALGSGSSAINAVSCIGSISTDQRGYSRSTSGNLCDAGAYEFGAINPVQTTALSAVSGSGTYGATATLLATLSANGTGVAGKTIAFSLNGTTLGSATTGSSGIATLTGVSLSGINAGAYPGAIGASFAGDSGATASSGSGTLTVAKANQTLSFDLSTLPAKALGDPSFDIASYASASSGLPVSFSSATPTICSVAGSMVSLLAVGTCTLNADQAGNGNYIAAPQAQQSLDVADTTPPVTTASAVKADNSPYTFGSWANQAVTVTLAATDSGSGVASTLYTLNGGTQSTYTTPISISTEGTHTLTYWSVDAASNEETPHLSVEVKIDLTAPTISGTATTSPNANGWYNGSVTIHWTCADSGGSGLAATCPSDQTISAEGASQTLSQTVTDLAGNSTTASSGPTVNIDLTAPTNVSDSPDRSADSNGWYNAPLTITFSGDDSLSGIASCDAPGYSAPDSATASVSGTCTDKAGNVSAALDFNFQYDATAPTNVAGTPDRAADSNGWYNHAVTITFSGDDLTSGIAICTSASYSGPDAAAASVSGSCTDTAGNTANGSATLAYDATVPTITYAGNQPSYTITQTVSITCAAADNLSGIATTTCQDINAPAYTFVVGANSVTTTATDQAGNVGSGSVTFTVTATASDLTTLTQQFVTNRTVARQLTAPLGGIQLANMAHNAKLKASFVNTYVLLVNMQRGRTLTTQQADTLIALARTL